MASMVVSGCTNLGSATVSNDRFDYNTAVANSWKQQTLLNIVKLRYVDTPVFLDVQSMNQGYSLKGSVNIDGVEYPSVDPRFTAGAGATYTNKATISYVPIKGKEFTKSFMTPIPPAVILFMMQSGWPADIILPLTVDSINGLRSQVSGGANQRLGDPEFYRVIEILRRVQESGEAGMQIQRIVEKTGGLEKKTTIFSLQRGKLPPELVAELLEFDNLLGLPAGIEKIKVNYGLLPENEGEIAMLTHSMLGILIQLAYLVEVPAEHIAEKRTTASVEPSKWYGTELGNVIEIHQSIEWPENAFTAASYRDRWYWIDDRDFSSKRAFVFVMILLSLAETGGQENLGVVTTPIGGN